jgi:hypothetical protein
MSMPQQSQTMSRITCSFWAATTSRLLTKRRPRAPSTKRSSLDGPGSTSRSAFPSKKLPRPTSESNHRLDVGASWCFSEFRLPLTLFAPAL